METVRINVEPGYDVMIGSGILHACGDILRNVGIAGRLAIVSDSNVAPLYLQQVIASLQRAGYEVCSFSFPAGEASKNINIFNYILNFFAENQLTRCDTAIALGGGVTGDLTGFAAGCYMRGIAYVQIPTTLLAAVDSSVGGKTGIDLSAGKNLAGVFIQPKAVLCDVDVFSTLPDAVLRSGVAEAIKTALLGDAELFSLLEDGSLKDIREIVRRCVMYKGKIVSEDERETGVRKLLNLGHTPGHAIEKLSEYRIAHGHAVAAGIAIMCRAAVARKKMTVDVCNRILQALHANALPVETEFSAEALAAAALHDKKRQGREITVVMPHNIGFCKLETLPVEELDSLFASGMEK